MKFNLPPRAMLPMGKEQRKDRLGVSPLAFRRENPLTPGWLSIACGSSFLAGHRRDFPLILGTRALPSLTLSFLDFLSIKFREGWDKAMLKYIVLSSTTSNRP